MLWRNKQVINLKSKELKSAQTLYKTRKSKGKGFGMAGNLHIRITPPKQQY